MANKLKTKAFKSTCFIAITTVLTCTLSPKAAVADETERYYANVTSLATCSMHMDRTMEAWQKTERRHDDGGKMARKHLDGVCLKASELVADGLSWPAAISIEMKRGLRDLMRRLQTER
jgi:hypothetical protein